jgi:tetratricopeptide (TPR) repeat protein
MFELKSISKEAIPAALNKAERYRFLGEPLEAESICVDILDAEPDNEKALITRILALTDQFGLRQSSDVFTEALNSVSKLKDDYSKAYYTGIIYERRAKAHLNQPVPGAGHVAYGWFTKAMEFFEKAIAISPPQNEDAILRWNTCARIQIRNPSVCPQPETVETTVMDDDPSGPWRKR